MSNKITPRASTARTSTRRTGVRPSTARHNQQRTASRRAVLAVVGGALALVAIVAIVISATSGTSDAGPQTQPVEITGAALPDLTDPANDPAVGLPAPELHGRSFDGSPVEIVNDGRAKVVMFVAHWCPHCRAEVPRITSWLAESGMPTDVDLYAVSTGVSADAPNYPPSSWLQDEGWPITTMADDAESTAAAAYGLQSYPYFVVVDGAGNVVARTSGELTQSQFQQLLQTASEAQS
jgi:thiol-disulfide isomerase/thioredoxin